MIATLARCVRIPLGTVCRVVIMMIMMRVVRMRRSPAGASIVGCVVTVLVVHRGLHGVVLDLQ